MGGPLKDRAVILCLLAVSCVRVILGQGYSPSAPSKEYIQVNGQVIAIETLPACQYTVYASNQDFSPNADASSADLFTNTGCPWTASSNASWLTITSGSSGSGNGTIGYSVSANTSAQARTATLTIGGQVLSILQDGNPAVETSSLQFIPITPCRLVDTRNGNGPYGGPGLSAGQTRTFSVPGGSCGIPSSAEAFSLNVTAMPSQAIVQLLVWPTGQPQPLATTLTSDGRVKASAEIVAAGTSGQINVYSSGSTQLAIDINGYFAPATGSSLTFYPVTPCRLADTRNSNGPDGGPSLAAGSIRAFPVSGVCGIPSAAQALSLNLTAMPTGSSLSWMVAWADGQTQPGTSTLNAPTGTSTANAAIVAVGSGEISVYTSDNTNLAIDVNGYFAPPGTGGLSLYPLSEPCRVYDSRAPSGSNPFNGTITITMGGGACGLPSSTESYIANAAALPSGDLVFLSLYPNGDSLPNYSTLNAQDGAITTNMAVIGSTNGTITAYASNSTNLVLDVFGYFAP